MRRRLTRSWPLTGADADAVRHGLSRLRRQGRVFTPARSFHVMVPPEHRSWGAVPAPWFIDAMMRHLGRGYYVALLSAAAHHGASHQAAQVFQIVTDRHLGDRDFERIRLRFYRSGARVARLPPRASTPRPAPWPVSAREATVVDLVERPGESGGLSNIATIICEIGELDGGTLADSERAASKDASPSPRLAAQSVPRRRRRGPPARPRKARPRQAHLAGGGWGATRSCRSRLGHPRQYAEVEPDI